MGFSWVLEDSLMSSHGLPWVLRVLVGFHGVSWVFVGFWGLELGLMVSSWGFMISHGVSWVLIR